MHSLRNSCRLLVVVIALLTFGATAHARAKYRFKIATLAPEQSPWVKEFRAMAKDIDKATNGDVAFVCYPGGVHGDEQTVLRKMRIGQLQGAGFLGTGISIICPDVMVIQLPLLFDNDAEVDAILPPMFDYFEAQTRQKGYEILAWPHIGFSYAFSKEPIRTLEDLRASKPWLIEDDVLTKAFYDTLEAPAVSAQVSDVLTGLQSGLLGTVAAPPAGMVSLQWYSRVKYHMDLKINYSVGAIVVDRRRWLRVPEATRTEVRRIVREHTDELNQVVRKQNREALDVMHDKGIETVEPAEKDLPILAAKSRETADRLAGDVISREALSRLRRLLADYRREHPDE